MSLRWIRCAGTVPAKIIEKTVNVFGATHRFKEELRPARPCRAEAKFIQSRLFTEDRPVCDDCADPLATLVYVTEADIEKWGRGC